MDFQSQDQDIVEAIEEGKIVRVSESYAKREGLPILRKSRLTPSQEKVISQGAKKTIQKEFRDERSKRLLDYLRKPTGWKEKQVISEFVPNFNWEIARARRTKGLTRKHLGKLVGADEDSIKLLENGLLPSPDFILINKIQTALNLNLRKDKKDFSKEVTLKNIKEEVKKQEDKQEKAKTDSNRNQYKQENKLIGDDIEIFE